MYKIMLQAGPRRLGKHPALLRTLAGIGADMQRSGEEEKEKGKI